MLKESRGIQLVLFIFLITLLRLADETPLKPYCGFTKVKEVVLKPSNLYSLAEDFFGSLKNTFTSDFFLDVDLPYREYTETEDGTLITQDTPIVYADYEGLVIEIGSDYVVIQTKINAFVISGLKEVKVYIYEHVSINQVIGYCKEVDGKFSYLVQTR